MKVSIIIPFYNGENFCEKIFDMIFKQTYTNYEVICIDDGSTDNTLKILKSIEKSNSKVKVYSQKNTGPGFARKLGFHKSNGDIILFYDSDDSLYDENTLKNIVEIFDKHNPDIVFYDLVVNDGRKVYTIDSIKENNQNEGLYDITLLENYLFSTNLCTKIFKSKILEESMFYNGKNFEDAYTLLSYLDKCENFYYTKKFFYINNEVLNPNSLTKSINSEKIMQVIEVLNLLNKSEKFKLLKEYKYFDMYCYQFKNLYKNRKKWSKNEVLMIKKDLKKMRSQFRGKAFKLSIKYFSIKRYILYILSLIYL